MRPTALLLISAFTILSLLAAPGAAALTVATGAIPGSYPSLHRLGSALYAGHMLLSYATFMLLGIAVLHTSLTPAWAGWVGVVVGGLGLVGFPLLRGGPFAPPILAHSYGLLLGIVLLLRR